MKPMLFSAEMVRAILAGRKMVTRRVVKDKDIINQWDCEEDGTPIAFIEQETGDHYPPTHPCPYQPGDILYVRETWALHPCNDRLPPSIPCKKTAAGRDCYIYRADNINGKTPCGVFPSPHRWHPSIHMPREAARLFLRVTDLKAQRVQDITVDEILREGIEDIEPPAVCQENIPFPVGFDQWSKELQDDWYNSTARAKYIGWSDYADKLIGKFARVWNDCYSKPRPVKGENGEINHYESYPWEYICETGTYRGKPWYVIGNPWVWVIEFERITKEEAEHG